MARAKATWHRKTRPRTAEENGTVLAAMAYKAARLAMQRLLGADFDLDSEQRRFALFTELLAFQVQMADRLAYDRVDEVTRRGLVMSMGQNLARLYAENQVERELDSETEIPRLRFIEAMNGCLVEYSELSFGDDGRPGYAALRYLARRLCDLTETNDRRWLVEVIIDVEAPKVVEALLGAWCTLYPAEPPAA